MSGSNNLHLSGIDIGLVHDAAHAAIVIDMTVRVDHRDDRLVAELRNDKLAPDRRRALRRDERINDDIAGIAANDAHHREIVAARLIDAVHDLEQPMEHVEFGHSPEARIDGIRRIIFRIGAEEGVLRQIPNGDALSFLMMTGSGSDAIRPRCASSKSEVSSNGSPFR